MAPGQLQAIARTADLLVNISGHLQLPWLFNGFQRKAYIDIDPGFTQFWHAQGLSQPHFTRHDVHFTIGENIGTAGCGIPDGGIRWIPTRQPVVLDDWPVHYSERCDRFTTVGSWRGPFGSIQHGGKTYGLKVHEFRKFLGLPQALGSGRPQFELALAIHPADHKDLEALTNYGWQVSDPAAASATPELFRQYVQRSAAEFSVAQGIYVDTNCGWFSDRTVRYLASGKPALVQETGASRHIPAGSGLLTFRTMEEAVRGARQIQENYAHHCGQARRLAETHFAAEVVLPAMLKQAGVALPKVGVVAAAAPPVAAGVGAL